MDFASFWKEGALFSLSADDFLVGFGKQTRHAEPPENIPSFYFPDFFLKEKTPWIAYAASKIVSSTDLFSLPATDKREWECKTEQIYREEWKRLQEQLQSNKLVKAVPYAYIESSPGFSSKELAATIGQAVHTWKKQPTGALYGIWNEQGGNLGITPELLFDLKNGQHLETVALASTVPVEEKERLENDMKLLHEHQVVVEGIKEALSKKGTVSVGMREAKATHRLAHLHTPLTLASNSRLTFQEAVDMLHPTPALGAYPRVPGNDWLCAYDERIARGRFGAPVGVNVPDRGYSCCFVGIRQVCWTPSIAKIYAGGGVVRGSILESEWQELLLKWASIRHTLDL